MSKYVSHVVKDLDTGLFLAKRPWSEMVHTPYFEVATGSWSHEAAVELAHEFGFYNIEVIKRD